VNDELAFMKSALSGDFGWIVCLTAWQTIVRTGMAFVNSKLKEFMENALPEDAAWLTTAMSSRWYRITYFMLNTLASVKLPQAARKPTGNTVVFTKPAEPKKDETNPTN
jgi:hypothetical protein